MGAEAAVRVAAIRDLEINGDIETHARVVPFATLSVPVDNSRASRGIPSNEDTGSYGPTDEVVLDVLEGVAQLDRFPAGALHELEGVRARVHRVEQGLRRGEVAEGRGLAGPVGSVVRDGQFESPL